MGRSEYTKNGQFSILNPGINAMLGCLGLMAWGCRSVISNIFLDELRSLQEMGWYVVASVLLAIMYVAYPERCRNVSAFTITGGALFLLQSAIGPWGWILSAW